MTAEQFVNRLEKIRQKDKRYEVYPKLHKMEVAQAVAILEKVDGIVFDMEIDAEIARFKERIKLPTYYIETIHV